MHFEVYRAQIKNPEKMVVPHTFVYSFSPMGDDLFHGASDTVIDCDVPDGSELREMGSPHDYGLFPPDSEMGYKPKSVVEMFQRKT